ncbi:bifunctional adenosylcobinamide kinase/adenosylcobinamide-phosphate guanylyltransferase [Sulfoacidibacillus thermotolerans]|uniref:Adenosylcobinamide kinase n=1 Tax=Sulfoacidibacillus thermotolerans TaxID=1765684 RepID=A0A2U3D8K5_SULT2|nr:bifunctional adenosylcobinamide kinase/adenosylcobinamide-phosphate guanylyltransferase [Sulfoacidibacillus thermotolerans]PWI57607.1 hypothetical protein BM613_07365 [Sulfoacidibacillus thermotolerans]
MHLVIGGARSGKTAYAERVALATAERLQVPVTYIATGIALDAEMEARIARHQEARAREFLLCEFPRHLHENLAALDEREHGVLLIDCLSTYLGTLSYDLGDTSSEAMLFDAGMQLIEEIKRYPFPVVVVTTEVGMGIVPLYESARVYRDALGRVNAHFAEMATDVTWLMSGIALALKRNGDLSPCCEIWPMPR